MGNTKALAAKMATDVIRDLYTQLAQANTVIAERNAQLAALQSAITPMGQYGDPEGTANPYWLIIDPHQMFKPDSHTVAGMITGPFFSREAAQQHLTARRYAFGKHAVVYCHSAYWSNEYCALQNASRRLTQEKAG